MSTAANLNHSSVATNSRASAIPGSHSHAEPAYTNGHQHHHHHHDVGGLPSNSLKKGKQKKATDPNEASKLIAAKISQLELDAAGDKEQEAEIGGYNPFVRADLAGSRNFHRSFALAQPVCHVPSKGYDTDMFPRASAGGLDKGCCILRQSCSALYSNVAQAIYTCTFGASCLCGNMGNDLLTGACYPRTRSEKGQPGTE